MILPYGVLVGGQGLRVKAASLLVVVFLKPQYIIIIQSFIIVLNVPYCVKCSKCEVF